MQGELSFCLAKLFSLKLNDVAVRAKSALSANSVNRPVPNTLHKGLHIFMLMLLLFIELGG